MRIQLNVFLLSVVSLTAGGAALAQSPPPNDGFSWATIGAPGNRATLPEEVPYQPDLSIGAVPYSYRMTQTEITVGQWFQFVQAYTPYWGGRRNDSTFIGHWIQPTSLNPNVPLSYTIVPGAENRPTTMSWRMAARYCNWLQNGRSGQQSAFENGVYDTSTFTINPDGTFNDQPVHTPGTQYWIPTLDEWTKAGYYDPNRYGTGQGGYWIYPNGTNQPLISGYPEDGGQTNAGDTFPPDDQRYLDVGSYPNVRSPWGLLDVSGGVSEWLENSAAQESRFYRGTAQFTFAPEFYDRLDTAVVGGSPWFGGIGLRLASPIPGPATPCVVFGFLLFFSRRSR
jgi:formylglycine-generating enzyme required for sulfatase activity